jgi:predicted outer membrane lipoprotein
MPEGFFGGLNRHFWVVAGWVFTVGGGVITLGLGGAYSWIGGLFLLAGLGTLTALAYEQFQKRQAAEKRAERAERRLQEIPADVFIRLEAVIQRCSFQELAAVLAGYADYVGRMTSLSNEVAKPIALRTFAKRAGDLYVEAKLNAQAIANLRQDDPFVLDFKNISGLVTASALIRVHQLDPGKEIVWFRVEGRSGDELEHIDALAEKQVVQGKGYTVRPVCDVTRFSTVNLANMGEVLRALADEVLRHRG